MDYASLLRKFCNVFQDEVCGFDLRKKGIKTINCCVHTCACAYVIYQDAVYIPYRRNLRNCLWNLTLRYMLLAGQVNKKKSPECWSNTQLTRYHSDAVLLCHDLPTNIIITPNFDTNVVHFKRPCLHALVIFYPALWLKRLYFFSCSISTIENLFILLSRSDNKTKRGVEFRHRTSNVYPTISGI